MHMCHLPLQPHGCGYCSPEPHAPVPETSVWHSSRDQCSHRPGLCSPGSEHMEKHTGRWFGLSQDSPSVPLGHVRQERAVHPHYIPMYLPTSSTSQFDLCMLISLCKVLFSGRFGHAVQSCPAARDSLERGVRAAGVFYMLSPEERIGFPWEGQSSYPPSPRRDSRRQAHIAWQHTILQGFLRDTPCSLTILK